MPERPPLTESVLLAESHRLAKAFDVTGSAKVLVRLLWPTIEEQLRFNEDVANALATLAEYEAAIVDAVPRVGALEIRLAELAATVERRARPLTEQLHGAVSALEHAIAEIDAELAELRADHSARLDRLEARLDEGAGRADR